MWGNNVSESYVPMSSAEVIARCERAIARVEASNAELRKENAARYRKSFWGWWGRLFKEDQSDDMEMARAWAQNHFTWWSVTTTADDLLKMAKTSDVVYLSRSEFMSISGE